MVSLCWGVDGVPKQSRVCMGVVGVEGVAERLSACARAKRAWEMCIWFVGARVKRAQMMHMWLVRARLELKARDHRGGRARGGELITEGAKLE